jgi:hypothetical protein
VTYLNLTPDEREALLQHVQATRVEQGLPASLEDDSTLLLIGGLLEVGTVATGRTDRSAA